MKNAASPDGNMDHLESPDKKPAPRALSFMSELQKLEKLKKQQEEEAKNTNKNLVKERTEMDDLAVLMSLSGQKKP
jgi:hypothetical protein